MAEDHEVLRETWEGKVAVCFVLASDEVFTVDKPEPYYMMISRQTYFPLVTDKVLRLFSKHVDPNLKTSSGWLEDEGQPLKWHYPVGVLFDLLGAENRLPWTITVRFSNFPETELLECTSKDAVEAHFMSCVKEADSLKHRSQVINAMQKRDHKQLWSGLLHDKFEQFWQVNKKLMEHTTDTPFRHIPFRIHQPQESGFIQVLFRPFVDVDDGVKCENTLRDLLMAACPAVLDSLNADRQRRLRVLIQGVEPDLNSPILWLSQHLSHPDNFVHICIVPVS